MRPVWTVATAASPGSAELSSPGSIGSSPRTSYCGLCICSPCEVSSSLPKRMTRWCGWKTSLRNGWLNQTARRLPVASRTSISKIRKRGRRVGRTPLLITSAETEATTPGFSDAMVWKCPRSS